VSREKPFHGEVIVSVRSIVHICFWVFIVSSILSVAIVIGNKEQRRVQAEYVKRVESGEISNPITIEYLQMEGNLPR